jgi:hypothetical protein
LIKLDEDFGPDVAGIYEGALGILRSDNPQKHPIASHLARELSSVLPLFFNEIPIKEKRMSHDDLTKELEELLKIIDERSPRDAVKELIQGIIHRNGEKHKAKMKSVITEHPILGKRPEYLNDGFATQWTQVHGYFVKVSHYSQLKKREKVGSDKSEFALNWNIFESLLYRLLVPEKFFVPFADIDELLQKDEPDESDAGKLMRSLTEEGHRVYFFDHCDNPKWLTLLNNLKAFSAPQEPLRTGEYIRFLGWPESRYLARVADREPEKVYEIISKLTTENQSVLDDFIDAAQKSPLTTAVKYVPLIEKNSWLRTVYNLRLPSEVATLMDRFAKEGAIEESCKLATLLFEVRGVEPIASSSRSLIRSSAKPYFDVWEYEQILSKKMNTLSEKAPVEVFNIFVNELHEAVKLENRDVGESSLQDYSYIWRPNLSQARRNHEDAKDILLDGIMELIDKNRAQQDILEHFVKILKPHTPAVFRRIQMLVYAQMPKIFLDEVLSVLLDTQVIGTHNLKREYKTLLSSSFEWVDEVSRVRILKAISDTTVLANDELSQQDLQRIHDQDWASYVNVISGLLAPDEKSKYDNIVTRFGEPKDEEDMTVSSWSGYKSPLPEDELSVLEEKELLEFLVTYKPSGDTFAGPSTEGLGEIFQQVVKKNPSYYAEIANSFFKNKVRPTYIYHYIRGLVEAAKENRPFAWEPVLTLSQHILLESVNEPLPSLGSHEQDWSGVKSAMIDLIQGSLNEDEYAIPFELRDRVWSILSVLSEDKNPNLEDEKRQSGDPISVAINSIRGEAVRTVVELGLWEARRQKSSATNKMSGDVENLLTKHLLPGVDPSPAIRSVYGRLLPNLFYLNPSWVETCIPSIFPVRSADEALFKAALEGYLSNRVYPDLIGILKDVYFHAIELLGKTELESSHGVGDIQERLPQHLMVVYIHESQFDDLIESFFNLAPATIRAEAINFIGRNVLEQLSSMPDHEFVKSRVWALWDKRLTSANKDDIEELKEFGLWFARTPFDQKDTIDKILKTLQATNGTIEADFEILEGLASLKKYPLESITILKLIAEGRQEHQGYSYKLEEYKTIIEFVKNSGDTQAVLIADDLIHFMGSKGFTDFRGLL